MFCFQYCAKLRCTAARACPVCLYQQIQNTRQTTQNYKYVYRTDTDTALTYCTILYDVTTSGVPYALEELRQLLKQQSTPDETCAVLIEPVLGEGGYVPAPAGFLQGIRDICDENDILLISDEVRNTKVLLKCGCGGVQSGVGGCVCCFQGIVYNPLS